MENEKLPKECEDSIDFLRNYAIKVAENSDMEVDLYLEETLDSYRKYLMEKISWK